MRTRNLTGEEHCRHCEPGRHGPSGLMLVATKKGADDYAPCPHCEAGLRAEGIKRRGRPRWADGYWQGRPTPAPAPRETELSEYENYLRLQLLMRRYNGDPSADPLVALEVADEKERLSLLKEAVG